MEVRMSKGQRWALLAVAAAIAVAAFVVARPTDDDEKSSTPPTATAPEHGAADTTTAPAPEPVEQPVRATVAVRDGAPVGGVERIEARTGDRVIIRVTVDEPQEVHLHGYDLEAAATQRRPAELSFQAKLEGEYGLESHASEQELATLAVSPR
jgi:hypothetical protein